MLARFDKGALGEQSAGKIASKRLDLLSIELAAHRDAVRVYEPLLDAAP